MWSGNSKNIKSCYVNESRKNPVEIKNLSDVHIEDGLALTRFMFWVKENAGKGITEKDAADYLDNERAKSVIS